ncbi:MAG: hypothetical protein HFH68_16925 [Lachnospiraceae bacterium]|nr:hypothetical protein [Lachnospiraceae bacterium]
MYFYKKIHQNIKDMDTAGETDDITMTNWEFLQYWLYAAFPNCYALWGYLWRNLPYTYEFSRKLPCSCKGLENVPVYRTVDIASADGNEIKVLLYRYHVEYKTEGKEIYQPYLSYHMVENLDNDTFFLLLPIVDVTIDYEYTSKNIIQDLSRRFSETALPKENIEEVAALVKSGFIDADGAEDEPLWFIWQETEDRLYGAMCWGGIEITLFQRCNPDKKAVPNRDITIPEGEDAYLWGKCVLSRWVSSLQPEWHIIE